MEKISDSKQIEMLENFPVKKAILSMSLPVIMGMMVQVLYNMVDIFFISKLGDDAQTAAASLTTPLLTIFMAIASIISTGAASYISRCIGKKDTDSANETLSVGVVICFALGLILTIVGVIFSKSITTYLGAKGNVYQFAYDYAFVLILGAIPIMVSYTGGQLLRSEGTVTPSMVGMLIGTVVNIILDPIFIFVFSLGVKGAAIATVLGNVATCIYYAICYGGGKTMLKIKATYIRFKKVIIHEIFSIGIPASISQLLMSVAMIVMNNLAKEYGENYIAGMGISSKFAFIGFFIFMGFAAGCQPLIGYNYGAKNIERVKSIFKTSVKMTFAVGAILAILFFLLANVVTSLFANSAETANIAALVLRISVFTYFVLGPQMIFTTGVQAFGKSKEAMFLSVARQGIIYVPLLLLLNSVIGFNGLIAAQPIADAITLVIALFLVRKTLNEKISVA